MTIELQLPFQKTRKPKIKFPKQGKTRQSEKDACDINKIMAKFVKTGHIEHAREYKPQYGEATSMDFTEAMNLVTSSREMFEALPAATRKEFENNPGKFLDFVGNPDNIEKMIEMGLATNTTPPAEPKPVPAETPPGGVALTTENPPE